jgi:M-phase inducer tyrosine phosphatase
MDPPSFPDAKWAFRRITAATFCDLLEHHPAFARLVVLDCRSQAEYECGHITGAKNCHPYDCDFDCLYDSEYDPTTLFVFHCEFSAGRASAGSWNGT